MPVLDRQLARAGSLRRANRLLCSHLGYGRLQRLPAFAVDSCWAGTDLGKGKAMRRTAIVLATAGALGLGAIAAPSPAEARFFRGFGPALAGGLVAGAVIGGLASSAYAWNNPYGGYAPAYWGGYGPAYAWDYGYSSPSWGWGGYTTTAFAPAVAVGPTWGWRRSWAVGPRWHRSWAVGPRWNRSWAVGPRWNRSVAFRSGPRWNRSFALAGGSRFASGPRFAAGPRVASGPRFAGGQRGRR